MFTNTDSHARDWPSLKFAEDVFDGDGLLVHAKGTTLRLEPGESAQVDVRPGFEDPYLKPAPRPAPKQPKQPPEPTTDEPSPEKEGD